MKDIDYWEAKWTQATPEEPNEFAIKTWRFLADKKFRTLLDLGCGDGRDSIFFYRKSFEVTAVDFSDSGLAKLQAKAPEIKTIQQDIQNLAFENDSFDVIYAHLSLHYFDDMTTTKIFQKLHDILKKGGYIFIKCKSTDDPLYGQGEKIGEDMFYLKHVRHFFSKEYMAKKLKDFTVIGIDATSGSYHEHSSAFIEAVATK